MLAKDFRPETLLLTKLRAEIYRVKMREEPGKGGNCRSVIFLLSIGRVSQVQGSPRRIQA